MRLLNQIKLTHKALLAAVTALFFALSSPVMANEVALDSLLSSMMSSAIEATKDQLQEAIQETLKDAEFLPADESDDIKIAVLNAKPVLPVSTTATE